MYAGHFDFSIPMIGRVPALYARAECDAIVDSVRDAEWLAGTVNRASGREVDARVRDNLIAIVRDPEVGATLWARIARHVPANMSTAWDGPRRTMTAHGLFEPLRVYRYEVGHHFGLHSDQSYTRGDARSLLTLLVYLDDDFDGGETEFPDEHTTISPCTGDALWFQHAVLHAGKHVTRGTKHVLRTDVLYR
jgi:prolyl 4-hydroxylase